jgi:hypothetical protein
MNAIVPDFAVANVVTHFEKLPEVFLKTYAGELMAWAVRRDSPRLTLRLLRKPGGDGGVLDICHVQQTVELMVETYRHPVSGEVRVMVGPASNFDVEIIEYHSQQLPKIVADRAAAARAWANRGQQVRACFERIPEPFLRHYAEQFQIWGREFKSRGRRCSIVFDLPPGAVPEKDSEGRSIWRGAWFEADLDWENPADPRLVIRPADEHAEQLIEQHTAEMRKHWK